MSICPMATFYNPGRAGPAPDVKIIILIWLGNNIYCCGLGKFDF